MKTFTLTLKGGIFNLRTILHNTTEEPLSVLKACSNADIDSEGNGTRRSGQTKRYSGTPHSLDPNGSGLFVEASVLKKLAASKATATTITTLRSNSRMAYETIPGRGLTVFTNLTDIGYVKADVGYPFAAPSERFKRVMPAGQLLAYLNGVLYVARGSEIYYSEPHAFQYMDTRKKKIRMNGHVTLLEAVDDGIYFSDGIECFFLQGGRPQDFQIRKVAEYGAVFGMSKVIERKAAGDGSIMAKTALWLSKKGTVCMGLSGGAFADVTYRRYRMENIPEEGTALFRDENGIPQLIAAGGY